MRSDFEKNVIHKQIIDRVRFSEKANQYLPIDASSGVDRGCADVVNVGWISYQYQQSKVDELQYKAKLHESDHQALLVKYQATKKCWEDMSKEKDELQKRVDESLRILVDIKKKGLIGTQYSIFDLEQSLKGGSDASN